jgi:uncharacterized protein (TIGR00297 family)
VSAGVSGIAWQAGSLSSGGALAAWIIGVLILVGAGWQGGAVLAVFFVSSSLISKLTAGRFAPTLDPKGDRRDARQVFANGGVAALIAVIAPHDSSLRIWLVTATLAAAAADTWATSVGSLSPVPPRLLGTRRQVIAGSSGGVTTAGSWGAIVGAAIVSLTGAGVAGAPSLALAGTLIGFAGMLLDSLIGGRVQGRFYCPRCNEQSEWARHRCGTPTRLTGGSRWLNNDAVNGIATAFAMLLAWAAWWWLD